MSKAAATVHQLHKSLLAQQLTEPSPEIQQISLLPERNVRALAVGLYMIATNEDCPPWISDTAKMLLAQAESMAG